MSRTCRSTGSNGKTRSPRGSAGFSYVEVLLAIGLFAVVIGAAFVFFTQYSKTAKTESHGLSMRQAGRVAIDELTRRAQQIGYGIVRSDPYNAATWQKAVVYAGAHVLAFNADIDDAVGIAGPSVTIAFPDGSTYTGEGSASSSTGAETYVYTIDANGDGTIDLRDRTEAADGSYNPAAETPNPLDFALFRRVYGWNGTDYGGALEPIAPYLITNVAGVTFGDGTTPEPLFTYWLTEDLNDDGVLEDSECVNDAIDTCPPSSSRAPVLYLWGDDNFDGVLSEAEKEAYRDMPVGSADWSKNPLASAGAYHSTTLSTAVDPSAADAYILEVADASKFGPGDHIRLGSGSTAEKFVIESVNTSTTPHKIALMSDPVLSHAAGEPVEILPSTLLRAIRTVAISYDAIAPQKTVEGGREAAGQAGRAGAKGLDYQMTPFRRSVEVVNLQSQALVRSESVGSQVCPLEITSVCAGNPLDATSVYGTTERTLQFEVRDGNGDLAQGVRVTFSLSDPALGTLSATQAATGADGVVSVGFAAAGEPGAEIVTASVTCVDEADRVYEDSASVQLDLYAIDVSLEHDCLGTVSGPGGSPVGTGFTVTVRGESGPLPNQDVDLTLSLDPNYLPPNPNYTDVVAQLEVNGATVGDTTGTGSVGPVTYATDGNGQLAGGLGLIADATSAGARADLTVSVPSTDACLAAGGSTVKHVNFYRMTLASENPAGCSTIAPCRIPPNSLAPKAVATLSLNGTPIPGAPVAFSKRDRWAGTLPPGVDPPASVLTPSGTVDTDAAGSARVTVGNNGSPAISPSVPLETFVSASSAGDPAACTAGAVEPIDPDLAFQFEGPTASCRVTLIQDWVSLTDNKGKRMCLTVQNATAGLSCPITVEGIAIAIYDAPGQSLDPAYKVKKMSGGTVSPGPSCIPIDSVTLFDKKCNNGRDLPNGNPWDFVSTGKCSEPYLDVPPEEFFVFDATDFAASLKNKHRPMDVTVYYTCGGACATGQTEKQTFRLKTP